MNVNQNIKIIIYNYYTYSEKQIEEFKTEWKEKIKIVNKLFKIKNYDFNKPCFICTNKNHFNSECPRFYCTLHVLNTIGMKN